VEGGLRESKKSTLPHVEEFSILIYHSVTVVELMLLILSCHYVDNVTIGYGTTLINVLRTRVREGLSREQLVLD
jgi:hypothetical protein